MATRVERWVAMDGSEFETFKEAADYEFIETAVTRFLTQDARDAGRALLRQMIVAGYGFAPPDEPVAPPDEPVASPA